MGEKEKLDLEILQLVDDYNSICSKHRLQHRLMYNAMCNKLVLANREQLSYGSYQCELLSGEEKVKSYVTAAIRTLCFEYGE